MASRSQVALCNAGRLADRVARHLIFGVYLRTALTWLRPGTSAPPSMPSPPPTAVVTSAPRAYEKASAVHNLLGKTSGFATKTLRVFVRKLCTSEAIFAKTRKYLFRRFAAKKRRVRHFAARRCATSTRFRYAKTPAKWQTTRILGYGLIGGCLCLTSLVQLAPKHGSRRVLSLLN